MGAQQSSASAGGGGAHDLGIVTVSEGRRAAGTGAGRGGGPLPATKDLPMISDPQAVATLEALADLRQVGTPGYCMTLQSSNSNWMCCDMLLQYAQSVLSGLGFKAQGPWEP